MRHNTQERLYLGQSWVLSPHGVSPHSAGGRAPPHMISISRWASSINIRPIHIKFTVFKILGPRNLEAG